MTLKTGGGEDDNWVRSSDIGDLVAVGIDSTLTLEACNMLVVLLSKQGGALGVQVNIYETLKESYSSLFFLRSKGELRL